MKCQNGKLGRTSPNPRMRGECAPCTRDAVVGGDGVLCALHQAALDRVIAINEARGTLVHRPSRNDFSRDDLAD